MVQGKQKSKSYKYKKCESVPSDEWVDANVNIDGLVAIRNLRVIRGENGLFVGLPRDKDYAGQYKKPPESSMKMEI